MKRGIKIILLLFVLFSLSNCKKTESDILYSKSYIEAIKQTREELRLFMGSNFVPGASITVAKKGEIIYSEGIGYASKDLNVNATRDTKFRIGTLSELYTSAIYFKMIEEGKLHPDSSIQHYYPEFPEKSSPIMLSQLAQHGSGIREPYTKETSSRGINISLEKGIDNFKNDDLVYEPGQQQLNSMYNYNLLGLIMEKVEKKRFNKILEHYLTDTLQLNNTIVENSLITIENRSNFFDHNIISQVVNATTTDLRYRAPADGILSNSEDLVKLANALLYSDYFNQETKENIFKPMQYANGLPSGAANGWIILMDRKGNKIYGKDGAVIGGSASILVHPVHELVIAFSTNLTNATGSFPIFKIADFYTPESGEENSEETK